MRDHVDALLDGLRSRAWHVVVTDVRMEMPAPIVLRHGVIQPDYAEFLARVTSCVNPERTAWFLTRPDFLGDSDSAFRWNEFESQSLEAAARDPRWVDEVKAFWSDHLPILMSVKSGYAFLALRTKDGAVVQGGEPEYEDVEVISESFAALCRTFADAPGRVPSRVTGML